MLPTARRLRQRATLRGRVRLAAGYAYAAIGHSAQLGSWNAERLAGPPGLERRVRLAAAAHALEHARAAAGRRRR